MKKKKNTWTRKNSLKIKKNKPLGKKTPQQKEKKHNSFAKT